MTISRRTMIAIGTAGMAANWRLRARTPQVADPRNCAAIAFDAFAIFDPQPVFSACEVAFPGRGAQLGALWRTRQFEYQWLRALSGRYADFWSATRSALEFSARSLHLELTAAKRDMLMDGFLSLRTWPDVPAALEALRRTRRPLIMLSNATQEILSTGIAAAGIGGMFVDLLSTDSVKSFKPDPRAYQLGVERLGLPRERILFVASAGWDAAGAKWFGYPTFWNNRLSAPLECLDAIPDGDGASLHDLVAFVAPGGAG